MVVALDEEGEDVARRRVLGVDEKGVGDQGGADQGLVPFEHPAVAALGCGRQVVERIATLVGGGRADEPSGRHRGGVTFRELGPAGGEEQLGDPGIEIDEGRESGVARQSRHLLHDDAPVEAVATFPANLVGQRESKQAQPSRLHEQLSRQGLAETVALVGAWIDPFADEAAKAVFRLCPQGSDPDGFAAGTRSVHDARSWTNAAASWAMVSLPVKSSRYMLTPNRSSISIASSMAVSESIPRSLIDVVGSMPRKPAKDFCSTSTSSAGVQLFIAPAPVA